ncbi:M23 family metallopeptidase [Sphaerisporangium fuscum]|uniref:M23 family metallopeptidase n=1 Tax=Sphaerisporangium fuscum TaxID=2835868 RepID=UPI001BDC77DA|nr:M23 family metallopeptidase [Sphaerisporangium fuscum]
MRSGRLAAIAASVLVTAACAAPGGVAGISTTPPAAAPDLSATGVALEAADVSSEGAVPSVSPSGGRGGVSAATAAPDASTGPSGWGPQAITPPRGEEPVRVPPPRVSRFSYVFPVRGCRVSYARKELVLPKATMWTGRGCPFVSPVSGVVREANPLNRWKASTDKGADREGRFVSVLGDDGVVYLGGHLDSIESGIRPGVRVAAGQALGKVGDSGNAKGGGTNLYFAVSWPVASKYWWVRRGMVDPWNFLDAWLNGNPTLSPAPQVAAARARLGATPSCHTLCASKPGKQPTHHPTPSQTSDPDGVTRGEVTTGGLAAN